MLEKDLKGLDLYTLKTVKFMMSIYSDETVFTMGYKRLCQLVEERTELAKKELKELG